MQKLTKCFDVYKKKIDTKKMNIHVVEFLIQKWRHFYALQFFTSEQCLFKFLCSSVKYPPLYPHTFDQEIT